MQVQIRQQLSPMFRMSQALVGAEGDPGKAADALEAAAGFTAFERLAMRPGGSMRTVAAAPIAEQPATALEASAPAASEAAVAPGVAAARAMGGGGTAVVSGKEEVEGSQAASMLLGDTNQRNEQPNVEQVPATREYQHEEPLASHSPASEAGNAADGGSGSGTALQGARALVESARLAAERAQHAIDELAAQPRQHEATSSIDLPAASIAQHDGPQAALLGASYGSKQIAAGVALQHSDVQQLILGLQQQSEAIIR
jgi:hypothetical protein